MPREASSKTQHKTNNKSSHYYLKQYLTMPSVVVSNENLPLWVTALILALRVTTTLAQPSANTPKIETNTTNNQSNNTIAGNYTMSDSGMTFHAGNATQDNPSPLDHMQIPATKIVKKNRKTFIESKLQVNSDADFIQKKIIADSNIPKPAVQPLRKKVYEVIEQIRNESDEDKQAVDFVLKHPTFSISIEKFDDPAIGGLYRYQSNKVTLPMHVINNKVHLYKTLKHEMHHARKILCNLNYEDPRPLQDQIAIKSCYPFYHGCDEKINNEKRAQLKNAIERGDARITIDLAKQYAKNPEAVDRSFFAEYTPVKHMITVEGEKFAKIKDRVDDAIKNNKRFKFQYRQGDIPFTLYVSKYELRPQNRVSLQGYNVPDDEDPVKTLIADTQYVRDSTPMIYQNIRNADIDTEQDAKRRSLPTKIYNRYYKELKQFHDNEEVEFQSRVTQLPESGEEVIVNENRCRQ